MVAAGLVAFPKSILACAIQDDAARLLFEVLQPSFSGPWSFQKDAHGYSPAFREQEVQSALRQLRSHPSTTKEALRTFIRGTREDSVSTNAQIDKSIAFAVRLMLMVNCFYPDHDSGKIPEEGRARVFWMDGPQNTFSAFTGNMFHSTLTEAIRINHPLGHHRNPGYSQAILNLRARKLTEALGVPFAPTNSLAEHLEFDERRRRIYIFHHAGFLKHQLQLTKGLSPDNDLEGCIRRGAVPRRLAIEVLLSLQVVLFPLDEDKSMNLLNQIMAESNGKFDPETKTYDFVSLVEEDEMKIGFHYLLNRLAYLHDRAAEAPPTSRIGHYLHPWTHRHMVMLTAVGILAAFVGGVEFAKGG
ncbi:hypothetical protein B0T18DRAFT_388743 [Schizothecium vesticola]|uniref:Uncharacterized protein n=1 Tax=Schizothecium vesticola TaxID=314040 RepID=A0AA40F0X2_9PEZI|nr:hypothetical protein B0T18DRAFT_388743 [Schizothecium vesticola]